MGLDPSILPAILVPEIQKEYEWLHILTDTGLRNWTATFVKHLNNLLKKMQISQQFAF